MGTTDRRIAARAEGQLGLVTAFQLVALGLTGAQVQWRLDQGRLCVAQRGVYRIPGVPTF